MTSEKALTRREPQAGALTVDDVMPYVGPCKGNVSAVARALGVSRQTVYRKIQESARLQKAIASAREARIDSAESQLDAAVERGEPWAVSLLLRSLGRERGYGDQAELNLNTRGEVRVVFGFAPDDQESDR